MKRFISSSSFAISLYVISCVALFLYSFTQIDLSLTLSHASVLQEVQKSFQYIGYFLRPLSTELYIGIILILFFSFLRIIGLIRTKRLTLPVVIKLIAFSAIILTVTYNAFSYDLFNYIFDAKIITKYHENPYLTKALDFPQDPMLSFMRWTHRTYPYGPGWLGVTVPLSFAGLHIFTVTFGLFKLLMTAAYLGTSYYIYKILKKTARDNATLGLAFYALNPLVLIECLVSSHNDIVMLFFAMLGVYLLIQKRFILALLLLGISISIKFVTLLLLPIFLYTWYVSHKQKTIPWQKLYISMSLVMILGVAVATLRTNFQPWYLLYVLPFGALIADKKAVFRPLLIVSILSLFTYVPYLYTGNWDPPIPVILLALHATSWVLAWLFFVDGHREDQRKADVT